jgi:hypothetical protein
MPERIQLAANPRYPPPGGAAVPAAPRPLFTTPCGVAVSTRGVRVAGLPSVRFGFRRLERPIHHHRAPATRRRRGPQVASTPFAWTSRARGVWPCRTRLPAGSPPSSRLRGGLRRATAPRSPLARPPGSGSGSSARSLAQIPRAACAARRLRRVVVVRACPGPARLPDGNGRRVVRARPSAPPVRADLPLVSVQPPASCYRRRRPVPSGDGPLRARCACRRFPSRVCRRPRLPALPARPARFTP